MEKVLPSTIQVTLDYRRFTFLNKCFCYQYYCICINAFFCLSVLLAHYRVVYPGYVELPVSAPLSSAALSAHAQQVMRTTLTVSPYSDNNYCNATYFKRSEDRRAHFLIRPFVKEFIIIAGFHFRCFRRY